MTTKLGGRPKAVTINEIREKRRRNASRILARPLATVSLRRMIKELAGCD